jgi:hypothetical protein
MPSSTRAKTLAIFGASFGFCALVATIFVLAARDVIEKPLALLMLVALFGLYVGFGILIFAYRLVSKLD